MFLSLNKNKMERKYSNKVLISYIRSIIIVIKTQQFDERLSPHSPRPPLIWVGLLLAQC